MAFLKDLLSPGPGASDEFSKEWQDAFGMFDPPRVQPSGAGGGAAAATSSGGAAAHPPSNPPSPTGFLPSQLLDHSLSATGGTQRRPLLEGGSRCSIQTGGERIIHHILLFVFL